MEMVAEAAVSFAVEKLGEAVINKLAFLQGVEEQVNMLKDELERMYGLLQDAAQKPVTNEGIRVWISQIRQVAHDAEDVIETFNLKIDTPRRDRGLLQNCACFPSRLNHLDNLGKEIESLRARLKVIFESRKTYDIQDLGKQKEIRRSNIAYQRRRLLPQRKDEDVVGLDKDVELLLGEAILNDRPGLSIARITGMGGLGKSTLAREVYNNADVVARFKENRAWVVVSEEFDQKEVFKKLVLELVEREDKETVRQSMEKLSAEELISKLFERLTGREYFIVLDDVWHQQHWESLAEAFPNEQDKKSRLLVTSRNRNVPRTARYAHELKPLDTDMSWQLFLKKSFIDNCKCPSQLEDIGREIVSKCRGLPLAITVMGGLLLEEAQSRGAWEKILKQMNSLLGRSENSVSAILELSYHDLPPRLKSCFLCLGFFREDATIRTKKLVQVWIAEGLISQGEREETMEEIALGYLDELIKRNIVQIKDMRKDDHQVKSCQIHDLVRDLSIKKATEEIGLEILKEGTNSQASDKSRHRAIYYSTDKFNFSMSPNNKHVRSLFIDGAIYIEGIPSLNFKSYTLLRVLDFEAVGLKMLSKTIGELIGLKYLGLRDNDLEELPSSVGHLKNLQVLDIGRNIGIKMPNVIWKMKNLRHLYMSTVNSDTPLRLDTLKDLQTLIYLPKGKWQPKHLMELTNLRKLEVFIDKYVTDVREFIASFAKMKNLACLKLNLVCGDVSRITLDGLVDLQCLTELELWGELTAFPSVDKFPPNLSQLTLDDIELNEDPMPVLEKLPKLQYLNLRNDVYFGTEMMISDKGFPALRVLRIRGLKELRKIELVRDGGMPELRRLEISNCGELRSLPNKVLTLRQGFEISDCPNLTTLLPS